MEESQIERWEVLQSASAGLRCEMHLQLPNWPGSINRAKVLEATAGLCRVDTLLGDRRVPKGAVKDPWIFSDPASSSPVFEDNHIQSLAETQILILREQLTISLAAGGKIDPAGNNGDRNNKRTTVTSIYFHIALCKKVNI